MEATTGMNGNAGAGNNAGAAAGGQAAAASGGAAGSGAPVYGNVRSASLYVGDLAPSTTESQLFEAFSQVNTGACAWVGGWVGGRMEGVVGSVDDESAAAARTHARTNRPLDGLD